MTAGAVWHVLRLPALVAAITAWALIAALLSDGWLEHVALGLLSAVVILVVAKLYEGVRPKLTAKA